MHDILSPPRIHKPCLTLRVESRDCQQAAELLEVQCGRLARHSFESDVNWSPQEDERNLMARDATESDIKLYYGQEPN